MKVISRYIEYKPQSGPWRIVPLGDVHVGSTMFSEKHFRETIQRYAKDPRAMVILMGDVFDAIVPHGLHDQRFQPSFLDGRFAGEDRIWRAFVKEAASLLRPIADRIVMAIDGNHELKIHKRHGVDLTGMLCEELGLSHEVRAGYAAFLLLSFRQKHIESTSRTQTLSVFAAHGISTGGRTEGGHITSLSNVLRGAVRCDLALFGHNHRASDWDNVVLEPDRVRKKIISRREVRVNTGTFLKSYTSDHRTSYAEEKLMKPGELAYYEIEVAPNHKGVKCVPRKIVFG